MNELTYSLCQKPVLGLVMYLSSLCVFPPPLENVPLPLDRPGGIAEGEFEAPATTAYSIELVFKYSEKEFAATNGVVGSGQAATCKDKYSSLESIRIPDGFSGIATPLEISIRTPNGTSVEHFFVSGACGAAWWAKGEIGRILATVDLPRGNYRLTAKYAGLKEIPGPLNCTISVSPRRSK